MAHAEQPMIRQGPQSKFKKNGSDIKLELSLSFLLKGRWMANLHDAKKISFIEAT